MYKSYAKEYDERRKNSDDSDDSDDSRDSRDSDDSYADLSDNNDIPDRYVGQSSEVFKSKSLNELKPFYNGSTLDARMADIRKSIYHIRLNWGDFNTFLSKLETFLRETCEMEFKKKVTKKHAERLFSMNRDWLRREDVGTTKVTYEAIRLYTSDEGYNAIYSLGNAIFRKEDSVTSVDLIRSVVFLVELINIDLYNYCMVFPEKYNFEGVVYRGLTVAEQDREAFKSLRSCSIGKRNVSVPLGLFSSSTMKDVAKKFIKKQMERQKTGETPKTPLLYKIHVIGLKKEYIEHYTKTFPSTTLTTICAVDIQNISRHRSEHEVLLRGPFFQVLDVFQEENCIGDKPCDVIEVVMLNANRDHISTSFLGDQDERARVMFGCMVTVVRSEFALKYCTEKGLLADAEEYSRLLRENEMKLKELMN